MTASSRDQESSGIVADGRDSAVGANRVEIENRIHEKYADETVCHKIRARPTGLSRRVFIAFRFFLGLSNRRLQPPTCLRAGRSR